MARPNVTRVAIALSVLAHPVVAACPFPDPIAGPPTAPAPLAVDEPPVRPALPTCLEQLTAPNQENCPRNEIAAYSAAILAYSAALQARVDASNTYANSTAEYANSAIDHAQAARTHADAILAWAQCEIGAINNKIED